MNLHRVLCRALFVLAALIGSCTTALAFTLQHEINGTPAVDDQAFFYTPGIPLTIKVTLDNSTPIAPGGTLFYQVTVPPSFVFTEDNVECGTDCDGTCPVLIGCSGGDAFGTPCLFSFPSGISTFPVCFTITLNAPCSASGQYALVGRFQVGQTQASTAQRLLFAPGVVPPTIKFDGDDAGNNTKIVDCGETNFDAGVTGTDACANDITGSLVASGTVNTKEPGTYTRTYTLIDADGNRSSRDRQIVVTANCFDIAYAFSGAGLINPGDCTGSIPSLSKYYVPGKEIVQAVSLDTNITQGAPFSYDLVLPLGSLLTNSGDFVRGKDPYLDTNQVVGNTIVYHFLFQNISPGSYPYAFTVKYNTPATPVGDYNIKGVLQGVPGSNLQELDSTLKLDTTPPVIAFRDGQVTRVDCGQNFDYFDGVSVFDDADGTISSTCVGQVGVVNPDPGSYTLSYSVSDSSGNRTVAQRTVVVKGVCSAEGQNNCAGCLATIDTDGDGLIDCDENCVYGTSPKTADTDSDGMDDRFEVEHPFLDPFRNDAGEDFDGDGLTNLKEYQLGSNLADSNDPQLSFVVSILTHRNDPDNPDDGTRNHPYATIQEGIDAAAAADLGDVRRRVIVLGGRYKETVTMRPLVNVSGEPLPAPGGAVPTIIEGMVIGADNADLAALVVDGAGVADILYDARTPGAGATFEGIRSSISNVIFRGGDIGILTDGVRGSETTIENCNFRFVQVGVEIDGGIPTLRRSQFSNITAPAGDTATGIYIRATTLTLPTTDSLGATTDPTVGFNQFNISTISGPAIINERATPLKMENNDWKSNDETAIAAAIAGPADFVPFLASGSSILAGGLTCAVIDAATQQRITNASVTLTISDFSAVTANENGIYAYPAVSSGSYQVTASAPTYGTASKGVYIGPGQLQGVVVALGEPPADGGCLGRQQTAKLQDKAGDVLVAGIALASMVIGRRFMRRGV